MRHDAYSSFKPEAQRRRVGHNAGVRASSFNPDHSNLVQPIGCAIAVDVAHYGEPFSANP